MKYLSLMVLACALSVGSFAHAETSTTIDASVRAPGLEARSDLRGEIRDPMMRKDSEEKRAYMRDTMEEKRETMRDYRDDRMEERAEFVLDVHLSIGNRIVARLDAGHDRLATLAERIDDRIDEYDADETETARDHHADAVASLEIAADEIAAADAELAAWADTDVDAWQEMREDARIAKDRYKTHARAAQQALIEAHQSLRMAVDELKDISVEAELEAEAS